MPEMQAYKTGMFSWTDLATGDVGAAKGFYGPLFGWSFTDIPTDQGDYSMALLGGKMVAAAYGLGAAEQQAGIGPHWRSYVTVEDVDARAAKVAQLGGEVVEPPFDVEGSGRMAVIVDPSGAALCLWQPRGHQGAQVQSEPGALGWVELASRDPKAAEAFYAALLGWAANHEEIGGMPYTRFLVDGQLVAGMSAIDPAWGDMPSHWSVFFAVADCDDIARQIAALGGAVRLGPADIPGVGRFALCNDPQGAAFGIFTGA